MAADHSARIAAIDAILRAGAKSVVTEGVSVTYDFEALERERRRLEKQDGDRQGRRPVASNLNLGGF